MNANLLLDDVFGIETPAGERRTLSLPALLAALGDGEAEHLTGIQRHQADAFHMFLCYLAGAALDQTGETDPTQNESFWRDALRQLAGRDDDDAWTLLVDDPTKPAFMQPPVPNRADFDSYKPKAATPDELDVLQTSKNHDLKAARLNKATAEAWSLALISVQTMRGHAGRGNYPVCRIKGAYSARVCVASNTSLQPSRRWQEDMARLLKGLHTLLPPQRPFHRNGYRLLWLVPWDGKTGLGLDTLHPLFIEICHLFRLTNGRGKLLCLDRPAQAARITVSKETAGNVGDPWIPLDPKDQAALSISTRGFHAQLLRDLIISPENYIPAMMQSFDTNSKSAWFHASAVARNPNRQGVSEGYHEARIYISPKAKSFLLQGGQPRERLADLSDWALTRARDVRSKALRPALFALVEGGPGKWPDTGRREAGQWVDSWLTRYDHRWADGYFPWLWNTIDQSDEAARRDWLSGLKALADGVLEQAVDGAPQRTGRRYRGKVRASGLFHSQFKRHFQQEMSDAAA